MQTLQGASGPLTLNPQIEKHPQHHHKHPRTHHIPNGNLRPHGPPKEPKVTRVPQPPIHPRRHKLMPLPTRRLHPMIKIRARMRHRKCPDPLPHDDHHTRRRRQPGRREAGAPLGEEEGRQDGLGEGEGVGVEGLLVVAVEQEGAHARLGHVVPRVRPELEEVVDAQQREEEEGAPQRVRGG